MLRRAVHALALCGFAHGCRYAADPTASMPAGHPTVRRLREVDGGRAPDAIVPDAAGGRFIIPGGGITVPRPGYNVSTADVLDSMAKDSVASGNGPLCYWSWQSLPPPPDANLFHTWGPRGTFDFDKMEKKHEGSIVAIRDLCTYAVDRLQAHVNKSGVVVHASVTQGTEFATYLCNNDLHLDRGEHPERCAVGSPLYNQTWGLRWPMSVTMWKFDGTNSEEVTRTMKAWRAESSQHLPNIMSPGPSPPAPPPSSADTPVRIPPPKPDAPVPAGGGTYPHAGTGWGAGGGLVGKALPCNAIPPAFRYQPRYAQDTTPAGYTSTSGKTFLEDALDFWSATPGVLLPEPSTLFDASASK